jgi:uncharacterized protein
MDTVFKVDAIVNDENDAYHRFLRKDELRCQQCSDCGHVRPPASWLCPECLSESFEWAAMSGRAEVRTFVWYLEDLLDTRYATDWAWREVPYNVAIVKLAEGPELITNIEDSVFGELKAGQAVRPRFVPISDDYAILRFGPE